MCGLIFILLIPLLILALKKKFPYIEDDEKIGDVASALCACGYSLGDLVGPFLGGIMGEHLGF